VLSLIAQFESTLARLQSSEQQIEELKSQLDDALGAEEIRVQLNEKNMTLTDVSNA
jgi:dynactin 1